MHRFLNVVYAYLVESVRRPEQTLHDATLVVDKMIAPPPSPAEEAESTAKDNLAAMRALGAVLPRPA